jgi:hypothetical protein
MGYWNQGRDGTSLHTEDTGLIWGDAPADVMDAAVRQINAAFIADIGRPATADEIRAGLEFALPKGQNPVYNGKGELLGYATHEAEVELFEHYCAKLRDLGYQAEVGPDGIVTNASDQTLAEIGCP